MVKTWSKENLWSSSEIWKRIVSKIFAQVMIELSWAKMSKLNSWKFLGQISPFPPSTKAIITVGLWPNNNCTKSHKIIFRTKVCTSHRNSKLVKSLCRRRFHKTNQSVHSLKSGVEALTKVTQMKRLTVYK